MLSCFSRVRLFATPWTVARRALLSMGFPRQEYWSGLPFPPPGDIPVPGIKPASPVSPALQADSLPLEPLGEPLFTDGGDYIIVYAWQNSQNCTLKRVNFTVCKLQANKPDGSQKCSNTNWAWLSGKEPVDQSRRHGSIPGSGRSPGEGNGNSLQCSCLENPHGQTGGLWGAPLSIPTEAPPRPGAQDLLN